MAGCATLMPLSTMKTMRTRIWLWHSSTHRRRGLQSLSGLPCRLNDDNLARCISSQRRAPTATPLPTATFRRYAHVEATPAKSQRKITFVDKDGSKHVSWGSDGESLLRLAQTSPMDIEGACGGLCACSTCHVVVEGDEMFAKMKTPTEDENDMLDLASGLTDTSRLSCQVTINKESNGLVVSAALLSKRIKRL